VAATVVPCAFSHAGIAVLAPEGVFILGYLLAAGAPPGLTDPGRWLRRQAVLLVAGLIATGAVLAAYAVRPADSVWLALAGLAATVAAYLIALPSWRRGR
jgi:hypothetical protein